MKTEENTILLKRTSDKINNYNPYLMTTLRSNHDIKFVPSGKDGYNIAFYVSEYQTKAQIATHQILPLISVAKKQVDITNATDDATVKAKAFINKCLNRILTETEVSASHASHFLLGHSDHKSSHYFTRLNLHNALGWLSAEVKKYEHNLDEAAAISDITEKIIQDVINTLAEISVDHVDEIDNDEIDENSDDDDENDDNDTETTCNNMYTISTGNTGLVLVNQVIDYIFRGDQLSDMCLYEYCSKVHKTKFTEEEKIKYLNELKRIDFEEKNPGRKRRTGPRPQKKYFFSDEHPQSETHWQKLRTEGLIPALSKLPSNPNTSEEKFQKCMLILFKPFFCFTDLYNGISWKNSYETSKNFLGPARGCNELIRRRRKRRRRRNE